MPLRILIIGGGIAGLTAAAALSIKGHTITVLERVNSATEVGFAFRITENSDRCLKHIGIDTIEGGAVAVKALRMLRGSGEVVFERRENVDGDGDQKEGDGQGKSRQGTSVFAFRPQLTQQLLDVCLKHGVIVKTGVKVTNTDTTNTTLTYDDPSNNELNITLSGDLIIACDGLHSTIRSSVLDTDTEKYHPKPSSADNCLRFMLPTSEIHSSPTLAPLLNSTFNLASWKADDNRRRILAYPVDFGQQYNLVCTHPESLSDSILAAQNNSSKSTYNTPLTPQQTLGIYADLDPRVHEIIKLADPGSFRVWKLMDLDELPRWSRGNTVLIGDAAHAVLPFGFSGASMAIEDAVVLAEILGKVDETQAQTNGDVHAQTGKQTVDLGLLLKRFEETRKPRIARVREVSREIAAGKEDKEAVAAYFGFLSGYDAVSEGRRARREILGES